MVTRGSIVCKLLATLMTRAGLSHIITVDLWQREIQGFFDCPIDNLRAQSFLLKYIQHSVSKRELALKSDDPNPRPISLTITFCLSPSVSTLS